MGKRGKNFLFPIFICIFGVMPKRNPNNTSTHRQCTICKQVKELNFDNFYRSSIKNYNGFGYKCKPCLKVLDRYVPMSEASDKQKEQRKAYKKKKKANLKVNFYKYRDKKKGLICDLDEDFMKENLLKHCVYCGFPSTGLDRIDNTKGHLKDNCVPCCKECNTARMDNFSFEEMKIIGQAIKLVKLNRI